MYEQQRWTTCPCDTLLATRMLEELERRFVIYKTASPPGPVRLPFKHDEQLGGTLLTLLVDDHPWFFYFTVLLA
ncbi:uncharacterized protein STEHIDRAFT_132426 [Stereum hirsutum FP-91666 SS1]|uniref:uncharacterized protein n=1 Tax=Stereum hirsutum (strain FP-91666) TaxID=721885 RepID=UPI00044497A3|nr:uncharacterized protein STEHIDRAFT_132426 [Stereum hirsutum FP-91666 SS1]EIM84912.1 hypothetical protein STEHIDRAFT_132426 [Stereum hirsutum FP-91666 SS1]